VATSAPLDDLVTRSRLEIEAVLADLSTVHPVRKRPKGSGNIHRQAVVAAGDRAGAVSTETTARSCSASRAARAAACGYRRSRRPQELHPLRDRRLECSLAWTASRPTSCGSAAAKGQREPGPRSGPAGPLARLHELSGGHNEGFPDAFKQCSAPFTTTSRRTTIRPAAIPTFAEGHREVVLCEAILKSHRQQLGEPVRKRDKDNY